MIETVYVNVDGAPPDGVLTCDGNNPKANLAIEMASPMIKSRCLTDNAGCSLTFAICHSFCVDLKCSVRDIATPKQVKEFFC